MPPFIERQTYPRGRRLLLVPVALIFLVGPYGSMMGGGPDSPVRWIVALVSIGICAWLMGLGITVPRRAVTITGETRTIRISATPPPPRFNHDVVERSFDDVAEMTIDEVGTRRTPDHGYQVTITFHDGPALHLKRNRNSDYAQDTVDHLVHLGLPGQTHADALDAMTSAPQPTTWL